VPRTYFDGIGLERCELCLARWPCPTHGNLQPLEGDRLMSPTATAPQPVAFASLDEHYERLLIDEIFPSKTNPRTHFDDAYLAELAGSIAEKGVIQPILVRELPANDKRLPKACVTRGFEIIAGECRFRASTLAKQTHIPAVVRNYTDDQVLELQLIENIHRQDLTPLEQAAGYRRLITSNPDKHSATSIAQRIGMSEAWVWDRLKLNDLIPEAKTILERGLMSVGHAILIARLKPEDQQRTVAINQGRNGWQLEGLWQGDASRLTLGDHNEVDDAKKDKYAGVKAVSVRELETWIKNHIRFDVVHAAKAVPLAFEPAAAAVAAAEEQPGRGKKVVPITFSSRVADDARDGDERTFGSESWERADGKEKSKTCEHSVLGVVVAGSHRYGETFQVCVARDKCIVHWAAVVKAKEKAAKLRESGKGTQAAKVEKKQQESWEARHKREQAEEEAEKKRWDALRPHAVATLVAAIKPSKLTDAVLRSVIDERMDSYGGRTLGAVEKLLGGRVTVKNFTRALVVAEVVRVQWSRTNIAKLAKTYSVDIAKLEKELTAKAAAAPAKKTA
jgi:ParB/RepB/Spo0J family partition protein